MANRNAVLLIDNASYHGSRTTHFPRQADTKKSMIAWCSLNEVVIPHDRKTKAQLWDFLVQLQAGDREQFKDHFVIDELCRANDIELIRLAPYHPWLNPVEFAWANYKRKMRQANSEYLMKMNKPSLTFVAEKTREIFANTPADEIRKTFDHCAKMWQLCTEERLPEEIDDFDLEMEQENRVFVEEVDDGVVEDKINVEIQSSNIDINETEELDDE